MTWQWLLALAVLPGCGSGGGAVIAAAPVIAQRHVTAGDSLLDRLPPGAEVVVELDLARLRGNPVVGEMARGLLAAPPPLAEMGALPSALPSAPLAGADTVVLAAYRVGTPSATTITVVRGGERPIEGLDLGEGRWALLAEGDVAAVLEASGDGDDLAGDRTLLATRAWAMPEGAEGAALRITARLPPAAQGALAEALGVDAAPAALSVWGDVADDLAVVARLADEPAARRTRKAPPWLPAVHRLRDRVARLPELGALGLARPVADADIRRDAEGVRVAVVIAPGRLRRAVQRWADFRGAAP